uniref:Mpv17-like protein n=1 Tax=Lygus hesperus TaxID=30085 RepID=A0A0A9X194_LYGHE
MSLRKIITSPVWRKCGKHAYESRKQLIRGMISYSVIWPAGSLVQQKIEGRNLNDVDLIRVARFCVWGCLFVAPTLTIWMTIARAIWPQNNLRSALTKALVEQVTYTPFAMTSFYFGMTVLEMKGVEAAKKEVADKFLPTYKVGVLIWPFLQTINYTTIPEKNRIVFVSFCSFVWTTFLAYMKHTDLEKSVLYKPAKTPK